LAGQEKGGSRKLLEILEFMAQRGNREGEMSILTQLYTEARARLLRVLTLVLAGAFAVLVAGCVPHIDSIVPDHGYVGDAVTINGRYFSTTPSGNIVTFGGTAATAVTPLSTTQLSVVVPSGAATGPVVVTVGSRSSNSLPFTVHSGHRPVSGIVDSIGLIGRHSSLALDSADRPRIAYSDDTMQKVKYSAWDGTAWVIETIDYYRMNSDVSLALSGDGTPHVSYPIHTHPAKGLRYAKRGPAGWAIEEVDPSEHAGTHNSLALTVSGDPRIAQFRGGVGGGLFFSESGAGSWTTTRVLPVPAGYTLGQDCSLALDSGDDPGIVFFERHTGAGAIPGSVKYAWRSAGTWNVQTVEAMTFRNHPGTCIALDAANNPRVGYSYHGPSPPSELRYAKKVGGSWSVETVVAGITCGCSLALDQGGNPAISYYRTDNPNNKVLVEYATWDGTGWSFNAVSSWSMPATEVNFFPKTSLALDSRGKAHVSYEDLEHRDLMYYREP